VHTLEISMIDLPTTGPASIAPSGIRAPIQLASELSIFGMSQLGSHPGASIWGRAGEVQARAVPTAKAPIVAIGVQVV
jgi:hypothetical protein